MRVALFIICFNDTLFPNVGIATTLYWLFSTSVLNK